MGCVQEEPETRSCWWTKEVGDQEVTTDESRWVEWQWVDTGLGRRGLKKEWKQKNWKFSVKTTQRMSLL